MRYFMVLIAALLMTAAAVAGTETTVDGVLHVQNSADPANGVETVTLEELWRVGGDDEESVLLGLVSRALVDDANNIYLLDAQLSEVQVFSPTGEHLKTIGRPGTGPGEITNPGDFVFMPDGTLGLVQIFPGKIVKIDLEGTPAGEFNPDTGDATTGGFLALVNVRGAGGNLVLSGVQIGANDAGNGQLRHYFVRGYDNEGQQVADYLGKDVEWVFDGDFVLSEEREDFIWWRMDVGPDGRLVVCEPRNAYALSVYAADGTLERVIDREYESWQRDERITARYQSILDAQIANFPFPAGTEVEPREQDVTDLRVARDGSIWVLTSRQMHEPEDGTFATYDVFTPDGHYDRQVRVVCEGIAADDRLIFAGDGLAFQVRGFWPAVLNANAVAEEEDEEPEPMSVICYRVK